MTNEKKRRLPKELTPLQGRLETVRRLRRLIKTGSDAQGRKANETAFTVLAQEERELGRAFADWCGP